jgi:hypothetical protein
METITKYENPKKTLDEDDVWDVIDDLRRFIDGLKSRNKELEEQHEMDITLFTGYLNKIRELKADNEALKALIPHQVDERG